MKPAALSFLGLESRLDVVWHNAGIMIPPNGSTDAQVGPSPPPPLPPFPRRRRRRPLTPPLSLAQGHELQMGTNVLGPWLLQHFLTPLLHATAARADTAPDSVRVIWVSPISDPPLPSPSPLPRPPPR